VEVADPESRDRTLGANSDFMIDAAQAEADLLVVATTRPQVTATSSRPSTTST
jgi:hypothetical protein